MTNFPLSDWFNNPLNCTNTIAYKKSLYFYYNFKLFYHRLDFGLVYYSAILILQLKQISFNITVNEALTKTKAPNTTITNEATSYTNHAKIKY
jgi:hypothetical protein